MYNFDEVIDRRQGLSMKWAQAGKLLTPEQAAADPLPMWVADMDFRVAPPILDAMRGVLDSGALGYGYTPDSCLQAIVDWQQRQFGWRAEPEWVVQTPGVVSALNLAIQAYSQPGDHVVVQTPVYHHFLHDPVANGRRVVPAPLTFADGRYRFDPEKFEAALVPGTRLFILCNPHNPTGNVWTRDELLAMAGICARHGIIVISDEVHQDLIFGESATHIALGTLGEEFAHNAIICTAPSKTFNTAGLQCANVFIPNPRLRQAFRGQCEKSGLARVNTLGVVACEAAYRDGRPWAEAMLDYIGGNRRHFAARLIELGLPIRAVPGDALYLSWLDCRQMGLAPAALNDFLLRQARLWLDPGTKFGPEGAGFMRINLACPRSHVDLALARLAAALGR